MDYRGWILSIYDEFQRVYNKENSKIKKTKKQVLKEMFLKENLFITLVVLSYAILQITLIILYIKIKDRSISWCMVLVMFVTGFLASTQMYKNELTIYKYHEMIETLKEVLEQNNLNSEHYVRYLLKYTGGVLYKIKNVKGGGMISNTLAGSTAVYIADRVFKSSLLSLIIIIGLLVAFLFTIIYLYLSEIPNSRIVRKSQFHQLLRILVDYEYESKKSMDSNIKPKEINSMVK